MFRRLLSAFVLVMAAPPDVGLVAAVWCTVEPLIHAPHPVDSARVAGIRVVDDSVVEREGADAGSFADVRRRVSSRHRSDFGDGTVVAAQLPYGFAPVVVFDAPFLLFLLAEPDVEVWVEVAAVRRRPRKCPSHPSSVRL